MKASKTINWALMSLIRRSEKADLEKLVETFVDIRPLMNLLVSIDHKI